MVLPSSVSSALCLWCLDIGLNESLQIQEVTSFHLDGSQEVVRMTSLMMEDSVSRDSFHLPTWIKVTSCAKNAGK